MAQAGFTPISLYFSTTAAAVPSAGNLVAGELALNTVDEKLYFKNSAGTVKLLASNATSAPVLSFSAGSTGFTPSTATTGAVTLAGTLATTNGGTGLTSFTSGGVVYASSSSALATGSALVFDGAYLGFGVTPSAWASGSRGLQILKGGLYHDNSQYFSLANNAYYDGTNWKYVSSAAASQIAQVNGESRFYNAAVGTAGNNVTYTQAMTLDVSGNLGIGTTSPSINGIDILKPSSTSVYLRTSDGTYNAFYGVAPALGGAWLGTTSNHPVLFNTNNTERARITSGGAWSFGSSGTATGNVGEVLTSQGSGSAPVWAAAGGGSGFTAKTTNYTAASGDNILANTSAGSWTLTLPASPSTGNAVQVMDSIGTFGQYPLTVARNGSTIMGAAENMTMAVNGAATTFVYNGSTWRVI